MVRDAREGLDVYVEDEEEFDPLAEDFLADADGAQGDPEGDEGIVDVPVVAEMPAALRGRSVFDQSRFASAQDAIEELLRRNPGRKPVFLAIIEFCCEPRTTSEVAEAVRQAQAENRSVYAPLSLCTILERAGALTSEVPQTADEVVEEGGIEYLEVKDAPEATWTSTDDGLTVLAAHREGAGLRELLACASEACYAPIYERVLAFCAEAPRPKCEIDELIDDDPLVQSPRRYSNHFIELLENREALAWHDGGWNTTELGQRYLEEIGA